MIVIVPQYREIIANNTSDIFLHVFSTMSTSLAP